jgi:hypothetical protein
MTGHGVLVHHGEGKCLSMDGLLSMLKFVFKISADLKFVTVELVHKMWKL